MNVTVRELRDCEQIARQNALDLLNNPPPPSVDRDGHDHAHAVARAWLHIAQAHDEYAVQIEQRESGAA